MIDIVFCAKGRPEFTRASLAALAANTNWLLVRSLIIYFDGDGTVQQGISESEWLHVPLRLRPQRIGGPVAIMLDYLASEPAEIWAKIDNDVIVPPGWLDAALAVMEARPELGLLGIEPPASRTRAPWSPVGLRTEAPEYSGHIVVSMLQGALDFPADCDVFHGYARCASIGGVGLFRTSAFAGRLPMKPYKDGHGLPVGGFTTWQTDNPTIVKGWLVPPISLFLLDRLPFEPWASLSKRYIEEGQQRPWTNYEPAGTKLALWDWWIRSLLDEHDRGQFLEEPASRRTRQYDKGTFPARKATA